MCGPAISMQLWLRGARHCGPIARSSQPHWLGFGLIGQLRARSYAAIAYPPGPFLMLSGNHVAISGNQISTKTITTMIRNIGNAARAIKPIS